MIHQVHQVHQLVERSAERFPDSLALTHGDETLCYADLADRVSAFAGGLHQLNVERADRVAIYLDKRIETVVAMLGTSAAGAVHVPVNPLLKPAQVGHILRDCDVTVLVTTDDRLALLRSELAECRSVRHVVVVGAPDRELPDGAVSWSDLESADSRPLQLPTIDTDVAAILYTSGSTGLPKGVVLSHRNVVAGAQCVNAYLPNSAADRILALLPLSFDAGMSQLTTGFEIGAHVVLHNYLLPRDVIRACERHEITALTCVPPLWIRLVSEPWPVEAAQSLRYFANTGGHMPKTTLDALRSVFPNALPYLMYGLTEAFRSTYLDPAEVDRRPESIGKAIPNNEVLLIRDDGSECGPDEVGELVHRGVLVSLGYWNRPELSRERFRAVPGRAEEIMIDEHAVFSGDLVRRDAEGFIYFVGRKDDMIKTSGYRISPSEVEEAVLSSGIVNEVAAFGVPDDVLGQAIVVAVSCRPNHDVSVDEVLAHCRRVLPTYMVPSRIEVRASLPRNANGKFDRALLRHELSDDPVAGPVAGGGGDE